MHDSFINPLQQLYAELPGVHCTGCGTCCVSPTCTLAEFVYLMRYTLEHVSREEFCTTILAEPQIHPHYEGNSRCMFLQNNRCAIHDGRTGACRLFGIPTLKELNIPNLELCVNEITTDRPFDGALLTHWLERIADLNKSLHDFDTPPYFITGFNLATWLDIYFDDTITADPVEQIRTILHSSIDLDFLKARYVNQTGIKDKIDKITILSVMLDTGNLDELWELLLSIRDDYPLTGTYFFAEAQAFLSKIDTIRKKKG